MHHDKLYLYFLSFYDPVDTLHVVRSLLLYCKWDVYSCAQFRHAYYLYYFFNRSAISYVIMAIWEISSLGHSSPMDWTVRIKICYES